MSIEISFVWDQSIALKWDADNLKSFIESVAFLHSLPKVCPVCEAPLRFFFRSPKGFNYYGLHCEGSPKHEVNFGQHKEGGGLFYEGDEKFELEFKAREGNQPSTGAPAQPGMAASQPAQSAQAANPTGDKAPVEKLNMIGAVSRAKKVQDLEGLCQQMLSKKIAELSATDADALLDYLKTL